MFKDTHFFTMQDDPNPSDDFGLKEQASETIVGSPDDILEMKSPTASAFAKAELSPRAPDEETFPFDLEDHMDPTTPDGAPIAQLAPLVSSQYSQDSFIIDEELFNKLLEEHSKNTTIDYSKIDLDNMSPNGSEHDPNLQKFAEPEPLPPLFSLGHDHAQLPRPRQSQNMGPVENSGFSFLDLSGPQLMSVAPQQLQPNQGHSAHASSAHGFSMSPYQNQDMNMGYQSSPPSHTYRAPVADMTRPSVLHQDAPNVHGMGNLNPLSPLPVIPSAPYVNAGPPTGPYPGPTDLLSNMGWRGGQRHFSAGTEFLVDDYPRSEPNDIYSSQPSHWSAWDDIVPDIEGSLQGLAGSPEGSGRVHPRAWKSPTSTFTRKSGATSSSSHKAKYNPMKQEPKIMLREKPGFDQEKPWVKTNKNKGLNNRPAAIEAYKAGEIYMPLPETPKDWDEFSYHPTGEMVWKKYEPREIERFLRENPRALTIWLQRSPADSSRRYSGAGLSNCRFKNCCSYCGTIPTGWYRVAFDENSQAHPDVDPMHNAGYAHLYCLERFLDFPKLCHDLDVRVDDRYLGLEAGKRNKMTYSDDKEVQVAHDFIRTCQVTGKAPDGYPRFDLTDRPYKGTLSWLLSVVKLAKDRPDPEDHAMRKQAKGEGTRTQAVHLGDLELFDRHRIRAEPKAAKGKESTKRHRDDREPDASEKPEGRGSKRRRRDDSESDESSHLTRRDSTKRKSKKRHRNDYETEEESGEASSEYDRRRKRQKKSTKDARPSASKPAKRRRYESSESNTEAEPESKYESTPGSGSDSTSENGLESLAQVQQEEGLQGLPEVEDERLPDFKHERTPEGQERSRNPMKRSREKEEQEEDGRPRKHRKSSRRDYSSDEEERSRKHQKGRREGKHRSDPRKSKR